MKISWQETARVPESAFSAYQANLASYATTLKGVWESRVYEAPEASLNLPFDGMLLKTVNDAAASLRSEKLRYVVVIGIGGSSLGAKAVYDALRGTSDTLVAASSVRLLFLETLDAGHLDTVTALLQGAAVPEEVAVVIISKSGTTTETVANAAILFQRLSEKFPSLPARSAVVTDEGSPLYALAREKGIATLTLPAQVGGRFSVFSAAGLLPLSLAGVNLEELRRGAAEVVAAALSDNETFCEESAVVLAHAHDSGIKMHDLFLFAPELESLGKWYRQLLAESIGKEREIAGAVAHIGLTPTVSIGTTDLHSVAQLTFAGPREKVTTFVHVNGIATSDHVGAGSLFASLVPMLAERSLSEILEATLRGVQQAYLTRELPFMTCDLEGVSPHELGAFMQYSMLQVMYLGKLLGVNTFDQPAVEAYKEKTRNLLTT